MSQNVCRKIIEKKEMEILGMFTDEILKLKFGMQSVLRLRIKRTGKQKQDLDRLVI